MGEDQTLNVLGVIIVTERRLIDAVGFKIRLISLLPGGIAVGIKGIHIAGRNGDIVFMHPQHGGGVLGCQFFGLIGHPPGIFGAADFLRKIVEVGGGGTVGRGVGGIYLTAGQIVGLDEEAKVQPGGDGNGGIPTVGRFGGWILELIDDLVLHPAGGKGGEDQNHTHRGDKNFEQVLFCFHHFSRRPGFGGASLLGFSIIFMSLITIIIQQDGKKVK